jgi:hypothetical protein
MFSENITNVHWNPQHCDDLLNSSRFYDVFLFFITDVHWIPKHYDNLFNLSRFHNVLLFFVTNVHQWILKPKPSRGFVKFVAIQPTTPRRLSRFVAIRKKTATSPAPRTNHTATQAPPHPGATSPPRERPGLTTLPRRCHVTTTLALRAHHTTTQVPPHLDVTSLPCKHLGPTSLPRKRRHLTAMQASRAHLTATQAPPHPRHGFLVKKKNLQLRGLEPQTSRFNPSASTTGLPLCLWLCLTFKCLWTYLPRRLKGLKFHIHPNQDWAVTYHAAVWAISATLAQHWPSAHHINMAHKHHFGPTVAGL